MSANDIALSNRVSNKGIQENSVLFIKRLFESDGDVVYPEAYGAVGNGVTDDTSAITSALQTGKIVELGAKTYAVRDLQISSQQTLRGNNSRLIPLAGSKYCVELSGFSPSLENIRIDDFDENIMRNTTLSATSATNDTTIQVADTTGMEVGMLLTILLDSSQKWTSVIDNIAGNIVTIREGVPSQASSGTSCGACYGLVKIGRSGVNQTLYWSCTDHLFVNASSCYYLSNNSSRGLMSNIKIGDLKYVGIASVDSVNDNSFDNIKVNGGHNVSQSFTGDGVTTIFNLNIGVNLLRDLSVSVNGVSQTLGVDYTFNTFKQIQFVVAPANGATISTTNFLDASIGLYQNNENNLTPYGGIISSIIVLDCSYGARFRKGSFSITDGIFDTLSNGILLDSQGTAVPLNFSNVFVGFYSFTGIECKNNTFDPSFSGSIHIKATPTAFLPPGAVLGQMLIIGAGSVVYLQRDGIVAHDAFATQITNNGTIYWSGNNSILAQDGNATNPAYSFGSQEDIGLYKLSNTRIGCSGNLILTNAGASLALGDEGSSNNPSLNFFSSNTGSYNTASSRIQAYGGTGSASSGTIEINCATLQCSVGFTGNKTIGTLSTTFSNLVGVSGLSVQNAVAVREGSWNRVNLIILGTMSATTTGSFSMTLFERTSNWSTVYEVYGHGSVLNSPPGTYENASVMVNSRVGTALADIGFAFVTSTSDPFVMQLSLYYQRL